MTKNGTLFWTSKIIQNQCFLFIFEAFWRNPEPKTESARVTRVGLVLFYVWSVSDVLLRLYYLIRSFVLWHAFFLSLFLSLITSVVLSLVLSLIIVLRLTCERRLSVLYFSCYLFLFGLRCLFLFSFALSLSIFVVSYFVRSFFISFFLCFFLSFFLLLFILFFIRSVFFLSFVLAFFHTFFLFMSFFLYFFHLCIFWDFELEQKSVHSLH